jgi:hypothetical protein
MKMVGFMAPPSYAANAECAECKSDLERDIYITCLLTHDGGVSN